MKNKGARTNSANRKIGNARYNVVNSATLPNQENFTSNVTDYNDGYSGLDMLVDNS